MSGNAQTMMMQPCPFHTASSMPFACFEISAGSATPIQYRSMNTIVETSVMTLVSLFVPVLLSVLSVLVLVRLVLVRCLTGLLKLQGLVGLIAQRASAAGREV